MTRGSLGATFISCMAIGWWDWNNFKSFIPYSSYEPSVPAEVAQRCEQQWKKLIENIDSFY